MGGFLFGVGASLMGLSGIYLSLSAGIEPYDPLDRRTVIVSRVFLVGICLMAASIFF